jgi:DNA-binding NarL/FixJ family response regulator
VASAKYRLILISANGEAQSSNFILELIFTDISLSGHNSLELVKNIKANHPRIAICISTGHDAAKYHDVTIKNGANWHKVGILRPKTKEPD